MESGVSEGWQTQLLRLWRREVKKDHREETRGNVRACKGTGCACQNVPARNLTRGSRHLLPITPPQKENPKLGLEGGTEEHYSSQETPEPLEIMTS